MNEISVYTLKKDFENHFLRTIFFWIVGGYIGNIIYEISTVDYILLRNVLILSGAVISYVIVFGLSDILDMIEKIRWDFIIGSLIICIICTFLGGAFGLSMIVSIETFWDKIFVLFFAAWGLIVGFIFACLGISIATDS